VEALCLVVGYIVGSIPVGLWYGRATRGIDIREYGSGNIGTANVLRTLGAKAALVVFFLDVVKGGVGPFVTLLVDGRPWSAPAAGICAVAGHCWSPFLRFSGGRGIATSLGALLVLDWRAGLTCLGVWLITVVATRIVSLGSMLACAAVPVALVLYEYVWGLDPVAGDRVANLLAGTAITAVALVRHAPNIKRLARGVEPKLGEKGHRREETEDGQGTAAD
jgi:glycerol-3-phosphate acyltransferase PlsY